MYTHRLERGQALVIVALALAGLIGIVALVVDGGSVFSDRRKAQNAADSAALAAALARIRGGQDFVATALSSAAQNGYNGDGVSNTVQVYTPPKDGPHAGNVEYIEVIITSKVRMYFARIIGRAEVTNVAIAVARTKSSEITPILNGAAIISLAPTSNCNSSKAFWVHGDTTLDISGGGVFVNSSNKTCAFIQNGNGGVHINGEHSISVVGGASVQKAQLVTPSVTVGAASVSYPPPFFMPTVDCEGKIAKINDDGTSMSPGAWTGEFPPNGVTELQSGVYCLSDGIKINSDIEGHNVVLKVEKGEVHFNSNSKITLDAPDSGDYAGVLLYLPMSNHSEVILDGEAGSAIEGTVLAPASDITIKGGGFNSQIIGYTVEVDGSANIAVSYNEGQNFHSFTMPEVQLSE